MSSIKFKRITEKMPESARAWALLGQYFEEAARTNRLGKLRLDPIRIQQIGEVGTAAELASIISVLITEHVLKRVVVVNSPSGGAFGEYASVDEVPEYIHDYLSDTELRVTPDHLKTIYVADI